MRMKIFNVQLTREDDYMDITKLVSDLGFPIASNIILMYIFYSMMNFYMDNFTKMAEEIIILTGTINSNTKAIEDLKEVIENGKK